MEFKNGTSRTQIQVWQNHRWEIMVVRGMKKNGQWAVDWYQGYGGVSRPGNRRDNNKTRVTFGKNGK
jgi:hypothetical protein